MTDILRSWIGSALPDWLIVLIAYLIVTTIVLFYAVGNFILMVWAERRVVARMQDRLGPNRVGPAGLLQPIADAVKMFTKEDIVPRNADRWVHLLAPVVSLAPVAMMLAVIPWGRGWEPIDLNVALLYIVAVSAVSGVGLMMAGWGSNNKFALLGAMRAVAQLVSYEIPAVTALLTVVVLAGGMSLLNLPHLQAGVPIMGATILCTDPAGCSPLLYTTVTLFPGSPNEPVQALDLGLGWWVFTPVGLLGFVVFFIAALAEGERTPFDIPEADSEIVAGYMTEYSGMKFATFYIAQYILNFSTCSARSHRVPWRMAGTGGSGAGEYGRSVGACRCCAIGILSACQNLDSVLRDDLVARRLPAVARRSVDGLCLETAPAARIGQYCVCIADGVDHAVDRHAVEWIGESRWLRLLATSVDRGGCDGDHQYRRHVLDSFDQSAPQRGRMGRGIGRGDLSMPAG
jgi:NADH:ubiquinone oxidoreductase subunit H